MHLSVNYSNNMKMEVEMVSKELIKPSSPTPSELKTHKLSFFDMYSTHLFIPILFFYPNEQSQSDALVCNKHRVLKQSLSQTLSRYYPFAGKIKDSFSIDCDGEGAEYVEARVKCELSELLAHPLPHLFTNFLPSQFSTDNGTIFGRRAASFQVTSFSCGGIIVAGFITHMIVDGVVLADFLQDWATTARAPAIICPSPIFDTYFPFPPGCETYPTLFSLQSKFFRMGSGVTRRFAFYGSAIAKLKDRITAGAPPASKHPTRVEALTVFLWQRIMAAFKQRYGSEKTTVVSHQVNLRRRAEPKYSDYLMGNLIWMATAKCRDEDDTKPYGMLCELREGVKKIDSSFVNKFEGEEGFSNMCEVVKEMNTSGDFSDGDMNYISFNSWCNFGMSQLDFGWGRPAWTKCIELPESNATMNMVILIDTRFGEGIEAWVTLTKGTMAILEKDKELLAFATCNPNPLDAGAYTSNQ